ncbi:hypothetical protein ABLN72_02220 [Mycobacterium tuberculosis]
MFNLQASQHFHCFAFIVKRFRVFVRRFTDRRVGRGYPVDPQRARGHNP